VPNLGGLKVVHHATSFATCTAACHERAGIVAIP